MESSETIPDLEFKIKCLESVFQQELDRKISIATQTILKGFLGRSLSPILRGFINATLRPGFQAQYRAVMNAALARLKDPEADIFEYYSQYLSQDFLYRYASKSHPNFVHLLRVHRQLFETILESLVPVLRNGSGNSFQELIRTGLGKQAARKYWVRIVELNYAILFLIMAPGFINAPLMDVKMLAYQMVNDTKNFYEQLYAKIFGEPLETSS